MHEETRRRLLRAAFLLLCIVPTVIILTIAAVWNSPLPARYLEQQLTKRMGMSVRIQQLSFPRRDQLRIGHITLTDPENGETRLNASELRATQRSSGWHIKVPSLNVAAKDLPALWKMFHNHVLRAELQMQRPVIAAGCQQLVVKCSQKTITLHDATWWRAADPELSHESKVTFYLSSHTAPDQKDRRTPIEIMLYRNRQMGQIVTELTLETRSQPVPIALIAAAIGRHYVGPATFEGTVPVKWFEGQYEATIDGHINGIQLASLAGNWLPRGSQGLASIQLFKLKVGPRGLKPSGGGINSVDARVRFSDVHLPPGTLQPLFHVESRTGKPILVESPLESTAPNTTPASKAYDGTIDLLVWHDETIVVKAARPDDVIATTQAGQSLEITRACRLSELVTRIPAELRLHTSHTQRLHELLRL